MFRVTVSSTSSSVTLLKASFSGSQQYLEGASLFQDHQHKPGRRVVAFSEMQLLISLFPSFADYEKTANSKRLFTLQSFVAKILKKSSKKNRIKQISAQTGEVKPIQEVEIAELALQFTAQPQACIR